jgi:hypothetical protein
LNEVEKGQVFAQNLLDNPGFENGKAKWTPNDTADFSIKTSTPLIGNASALWDADASSDTLTSTAVTIPPGMYGRNMVVSCLFVTASGTATHEIQAYDGSNILAEATITSSTTPTRTSVNFIAPSSGSISARIFANSDEVSIEIDSCHIGPAEGYNVSNVSQATFVGQLQYAPTALCGWTTTSTSMAAFSADTDCAAPTVVGEAVAPGTKIPAVTFNNMKPGWYELEFDFQCGKSGTVTTGALFEIYDGSSTVNSAQSYWLFSTGGNQSARCALTANFQVTTPVSSVTYSVRGRTESSGTTEISNTASLAPFTARLKRFPTTQETAYTADKTANSWSGYHDSTCVWSRTNTAFGDFTADASCALTERTNSSFGTVSTTGSVLPGITFTPSRAGRYWICAIANAVSGGTTSATWAIQMIDGASTVISQATGYVPGNGAYQATNCGLYVATNTSAKTITLQAKSSAGSLSISGGAVGSSIEWSIFQIDQSFPAPNLVNSVVSSSSGTTRIEYVGFGGATEATNNCTSTPCTIYRQSGGISSVSRASTGTYTINFTSGVFSAPPTCTGTVASMGVTTAIVSLQAIAPTTTAFYIITYDLGTPTIRDITGYFICIGPK